MEPTMSVRKAAIIAHSVMLGMFAILPTMLLAFSWPNVTVYHAGHSAYACGVGTCVSAEQTWHGLYVAIVPENPDA